MNTQNTKTMKVSKSYAKTLSTIEALIAKESKNSFDFVRLANAEYKVESKTASNVYKVVTASAHLQEILGKSEVPTFKEFVAKLPAKQFYSTYDGFLTLRKFNKSEAQKRKAAKQDKNVAAK